MSPSTYLYPSNGTCTTPSSSATILCSSSSSSSWRHWEKRSVNALQHWNEVSETMDQSAFSVITSSASSSFFFLLSGMRSSSQLSSLLLKMQSISFLINTRASTYTWKGQLLEKRFVIFGHFGGRMRAVHSPSWGRRWQPWRSWWPTAGSNSSAGWWWRGGPSSGERDGDRWSRAGACPACRTAWGGRRTGEDKVVYFLFMPICRQLELTASAFVNSHAAVISFANVLSLLVKHVLA